MPSIQEGHFILKTKRKRTAGDGPLPHDYFFRLFKGRMFMMIRYLSDTHNIQNNFGSMM